MTALDHRLAALAARMTFVDPACYPELAGLTRHDIYEGKMGPGGLYLAAQMIRGLQPDPAMKIMDLGPGRGATSLFLSQRFVAEVASVDLWIDTVERQALLDRHAANGQAEAAARVTPFQLDATGPLPFESDQFDLIFCMDAFHYLGARRGFLAHLTRVLKPGGQLIVANPCFSREVTVPAPQTYLGPWDAEFSLYHSPAWWRRRLTRTGLFASVDIREAVDGQRLWDDDWLYDLDRGHPAEGLVADAEQILLGRDEPEWPVLTHYVMRAVKRR